jgi:hypothetical protein
MTQIDPDIEQEMLCRALMSEWLERVSERVDGITLD